MVWHTYQHIFHVWNIVKQKEIYIFSDKIACIFKPPELQSSWFSRNHGNLDIGRILGESLRETHYTKESHYVRKSSGAEYRVSRQKSETWRSWKMDKSKKTPRNSIEWSTADLNKIIAESTVQRCTNYELLNFRDTTHDTHSGHRPGPTGRRHNRFCQGVDVRCCIAAPTMSGPQ